MGGWGSQLGPPHLAQVGFRLSQLGAITTQHAGDLTTALSGQTPSLGPQARCGQMNGSPSLPRPVLVGG